jgi:hypothetical protein
MMTVSAPPVVPSWSRVAGVRYCLELGVNQI